jgi:hypothetical protein
MVMNPRVGMRVRYTGLVPVYRMRTGDEGVICDVRAATVGVNFGRDVGGHDCNDTCPDGYGLLLTNSSVEAIAEPAPWVPALGDRVLHTGLGPTANHTNEPGIICHFAEDGQPGVNFDRNIQGHDCRGNCEPSHGWYVAASELRLDAPTEPVLGSRVHVRGEVVGYGTVDDEGVIVALNERGDHDQRYGVRFDTTHHRLHDLSYPLPTAGSPCENHHGLWVERANITVLTGGGRVSPPTTNSTLFDELTACPRDTRGEIPWEIVTGSRQKLAEWLLDNDGEGATSQEYETFYNALEAIRVRLNASHTVVIPIVERLLTGRSRNPVEF